VARARVTWLELGVRIAAATAFAGALVITLLSNVPDPLPGVALGSEPLFYIERGVAVFGALVIAVGLLGRGLRGELPSQVSTTGLGYSEKIERAVGSSDSAIAALTSRVDRLDEDLAKRDELLMLLATRMLEESGEVEKGKEAAGPPGGE
jgi:hypothetical protein